MGQGGMQLQIGTNVSRIGCQLAQSRGALTLKAAELGLNRVVLLTGFQSKEGL